MNRQKSIFRVRSKQIPKPTARSRLAEISDFRRLQVASMSESDGRAVDYITPSNNYDIKIVVYGLTGLVCEEEPKKKQKFGKKETIFPAAIGIARRNMKPLGPSDTTNVEFHTEPSNKNALDTTTAVVSCQKNGTSNNTSFETFLPSLPLGKPIASSPNKFRYAAAWPLDQSVLLEEEGAKDRSAFAVTRCMKQATFIPGIGTRSNCCHETIELGINISRGIELIRLGTVLIATNGEEKGEVEMSVSTTPFIFNSKKLKKKKNKYGYFSNDSSRRFYLDTNSVIKVGVQVTPKEDVRFAREEEKQRMKNQNVLNELLEQDEFKKILLQEMENENLDCEIKSLPIDPPTKVNGATPKREGRTNLIFPDILCGSIPTSWVPNFLKLPETEPDIPKEIFADSNLDQLVIRSTISSVSEATDASDILEGKQNGYKKSMHKIHLFFSLNQFFYYRYFYRGVMIQVEYKFLYYKFFADVFSFENAK
jgi:hypothetical protein